MLVMLYNGLGAALFQKPERTAGELREAEQVLQNEATHAAISAPTFQLIVLCNQLFVWAELGAWDRCGRRLPDFDTPRASCDITPFKDRDPELFGAVPLADALGVVIAFRTGRVEEAWHRLEALIGVRRRGFENHDAEIILFVPPRDFPTLAFLRCAQDMPDEGDIIELPALSRQKLLSLMVDDEGAWLHAYRRGLQGESAAFRAMIDKTSAMLTAGLTPLWRSPAAPKAGDAVQLTMSNVLANLPVALAPINGAALIERNVLINRPAGAIPAKSASNQRTGEQGLLIFANPTGDLPYANDEADALMPLFHDTTVLRGDDASAAAFFDVLAKGHPFSHIHFAGHAQFRWSERGEGGLRFAKGVLVDDEAIRQRVRLPQGPVVVLSACEAAISDS